MLFVAVTLAKVAVTLTAHRYMRKAWGGSFVLCGILFKCSIIMHFGYRLIDEVTWQGDIKTPGELKSDMDILQKIYEMV